MNRSDPTQVLQRLKTAHVWSKKQLGQHFLVDSNALEKIVQVANLTEKDTVMEIGPGIGVLSEQLLARAGRVIAFELDPDMVGILHEDLPRLEVVLGNVLYTAFDVVEQLRDYKIVANIPYQITTPLLRLFLEGGIKPLPSSLTLLVQKEVAERLTAGPRKSGRGYLSVVVEYFAEPHYVSTVRAGSFWPPPKVDSAIIHLQRRSVPLLPPEETKSFLHFVHTFFNQPRKQLKNVMAGIMGVSSGEIAEILVGLGLQQTVRAQELSLEEWKKLYEHSRAK